MKALTPQASSLFTISPLSPSSSFHAINSETPLHSCDQDISCSFHAPIFTPSPISSHYRKVRSDHQQELTCNSTHVNLPLSHSTLSATSSSPSSNNSNSTHPKLASSHSITSFTTSAPSSVSSNHDADDDRPCDDGSVASKLLSSITKSISSPSLQLKSCKEAARETPYQKTLKLKQMKLQHCAEALGMESSDNSSFLCDSQCVHLQEKIGNIVAGNSSTFSSSCMLPNSHQDSSLKLVKSSPNLTSASHLTPSHSRYTRSASFPPPLSHTLPTSSSYDSVSISLRAYREDGRLILKETMVPSKHYFQANRRNGRLTLRVFTREEEEEEHFASQDDHEEFSYRELQRENLSEAEEKGIPMCSMLSLYEKTPRESFDNKKVEYCNNMTNQSLSEGVCVKKSLGMHSSKQINVAAGHLDVSLQRLKYRANHNNTHIDTEDDGKRNVISNVITVSLQTSSHSKLTLHKAQVLNLPHLSSFPIVSSSLKHSAFIHSTGRNHGFLSSSHDMRTSPQSKENFIWESNLLPGAAATSGSRHKLRKGGGGSGGGGVCGGAAAALPAFVMEEKSLIMEPVSELATSLFLEARYASGDWCLGAGKKKGLLSAGENGESGTIIGGHVSAMESAIIDAQIIGDEGQIRNDANFGNNTEEEKARNTSEGGKELKMASPPLNLDLQFSCSNASEEWLHTLHCKELFDRQHFGQPLMKLHCIPTKS